MPIDTACSSSLVAIHEACQHIHAGECTVAIAGGVHAFLGPSHFSALSALQMLSPDGITRPFGNGANGMVPGEGVGAVMLKPLSKAIEDGDHIYGVIRGSGTNHGGKTNGFTVPNPEAHTELIRSVLLKAGVHARRVTYVEAHGTGTALGDPVEIRGLTDAFRDDTADTGYCSIGSVKSNIGHLEAAAGISGLAKVLLQLRHRQLAPSLHSERLNPEIDFRGIPFYVQQECQEWKPADAEKHVIPRIACVSSFGAGGVNAHILIEEYVMDTITAPDKDQNRDPVIIVLSAAGEDQLAATVAGLRKYLERCTPREGLLHDIAYTLQTGRRHMEKRLAFQAASLDELKTLLDEFRQGGGSGDRLLTGHTVQGQGPAPAGRNDARDNEALMRWWIRGFAPDWEALLYANGKDSRRPRRISLPGYPFLKEYFGPLQETATLRSADPADGLRQTFRSTFTGRESYLQDHRVNGQSILPGVVYLQMVHAAVRLATGVGDDPARGVRLQHIAWIKPLVAIDRPVNVEIGLVPAEGGNMAFEVRSDQVHSQGSAQLLDKREPQFLDIGAISARTGVEKYPADQCYKVFDELGICYGPTHRTIDYIQTNGEEALARITISPAADDTIDGYWLHPGLADAVFQTVMGMEIFGKREARSTLSLALPFALQEIIVFDKCTERMWVNVRRNAGNPSVFDMDLCDESNRVCVQMRGFVSKELTAGAGPNGVLYMRPSWEKAGDSLAPVQVGFGAHAVLYADGLAPAGLWPEGIRWLPLPVAGLADQVVYVFEIVKGLLDGGGKGRILLQVLLTNDHPYPLLAALSGLMKTAHMENPGFFGQVILLEREEAGADIALRVRENSCVPGQVQIRYVKGQREVCRLRECGLPQGAAHPWKEGAVYLITGGFGGLGIIMAKDIAARTKKATLILTGRSVPDGRMTALTEDLRREGIVVEYRQVDVTDGDAVRVLVDGVQQTYGHLEFVIHCAGLHRDDFILRKTAEGVREVLAPKIDGLINLDLATKAMVLERFILFSSVAGVAGNTGQADYAAANAFMDEYAKYRNSLVKTGERRGLTVSIDWPLWKEGGMQVDKEIQKVMSDNLGIRALDTGTGIAAFYEVMAAGYEQVVLVEGNLRLLRNTFLASPAGEENERDGGGGGSDAAAELSGELQEKAIHYFKKILAGAIRLSFSRIEAEAPFERYGIDSLMVIQMTNELEKSFGSLPKTLFFEYRNIRELTGYFLESHAEKLRLVLGERSLAAGFGEPGFVEKQDKAPVFNRPEATPPAGVADMEIAVVGLSGRYPQAGDLEEFWANLCAGRNCITEIPGDRWNYNLYFDPDKNKAGKTYTKWGGFLEGVDEFDASFFNISPREAETIDPQERLFLQCAYEALSDGGYTRETFGGSAPGSARGGGNNVGVYVGVMWEEYQLYAAQETASGNPMVLSSSPSSIANRVSYFFNFQGPSMAVDTMCSSSLTSIHLACQAIKQGECAAAIAGGVNVSIHPNKYLVLGYGKYASSKGLCESFGRGGDGYVPGEGVGAVLLKPLSRAIEDGDNIYGVIKGTAVNHGGKASGFTVPGPRAQAAVIDKAMKMSGFDAGTISYVEAHGTGTSLGDPIEIAGLCKAFNTGRTNYCAIGSVKSNIGHCESAAGIAGVSKVLLQMRHRQLAPSLHADILNPDIDFENSPFAVQRVLTAWDRPVIEIDGRLVEYPRRAGISSFGAGGSNAHVIIEEYISRVPENALSPAEPVAILVSAKSEGRLREMAARLLAGIRAGTYGEDHLLDIGYTLQVGREAMDHRLALKVGSLGELQEKLTLFVAGEEGIEGLYAGKAGQHKDVLACFDADEDMNRMIEHWLSKKKLGRLLGLWVSGFPVDWRPLYSSRQPRRISLPAYPFLKTRYWPDLGRRLPGGGEVSGRVEHPLVHRNTSTFRGQRYSSTFFGQEYFLADHVIRGRRVLPGAVYLEMIKAAMGMAGGDWSRNMLMEDIRWRQSLVVEGDPKKLDIELRPQEDGAVAIRICGETGGQQQVIYCQGTAWFLEEAIVPTLDPEALKASFAGEKLEAAAFYDFFSRMGIEYGPAHRGIDCVYIGEGCVLARLRLPVAVTGTAGQYFLHPSMLDASFQAVAGLFMRQYGKSGDVPLAVPATIRSLRVYGPSPEEMWVFVRQGQGMTFDIDLCDVRGTVCVRIEGFGSRNVDATRLQLPGEGVLLLTPDWRQQDLVLSPEPVEYAAHVVVVVGDKERAGLIAGQMSGATVIQMEGPDGSGDGVGGRDGDGGRDGGDGPDGGFSWFAIEVFRVIKSWLGSRLQNRVLVQILLPFVAGEQGWEAIGALLKTARIENPLITGQVISIDDANVEEIVSLLKDNGSDPVHPWIRYRKGKRMVSHLRECMVPETEPASIWRDGGVYLISGGAGGLGLIFAAEIARKAKDATVVLTGRSALDEERAARLKELSAGGLHVRYRQVDITDGPLVSQVVTDIVSEFGQLHGVIHSAGMLADNFILKKSEEEMARVLAPKVQGIVQLDLATRETDLDFFIVCSSTSAITGNTGQADYATANAYMDRYACRRNAWVRDNRRKGKTLSINWPLWEDGGMGMTEDGQRFLRDSFGMTALETGPGLQALYRAVSLDADQVMVLQGDLVKLREIFLGIGGEVSGGRVSGPEVSGAPPSGIRGNQPDRPAVLAYFRGLLAGVTKMQAAAIDEEKPFEEYGIDSVMVMQMTDALEKVFGRLSKTLFFEYRNISELAGYFRQAFPEKLGSIPGVPVDVPVGVSGVATGGVPGDMPVGVSVPAWVGMPVRGYAEKASPVAMSESGGSPDIAIVGLSGSYPQARDIASFWEVLKAGRDCITEIPPDRWDHSRYFDTEKQKPGKTYGKWGGFLTGVEMFDPLFFNITNKEAGIMDPQERLFLQCVYETLEDAGFVPGARAKDGSAAGTANVGVFVGVMNEEYQLYGAEETALGRPLSLSGNSASIANRISYYFNLGGPSLALNTMCSSSLTAIHLACQSLRLGECEAAIAGGVNVTIHPNKYMALGYGRFLSSKGLCESFGAGGDGYVPGEGVGAILLKPLSRALTDKDHIYGVIKGTAVNHGGKANGYTVPNPVAQSEVIRRAIRMSGFDPGTISYLEAHGTGTLLGDPIEINGLTRAFDTNERQFCSIGSVKSNIGHCESAAGIAGVTKVLLQMQHRQLVPSLHAGVLNPHIDFQNTPFIVQRTSAEWRRPLIMRDGKQQEVARRAGVSSFGAGGANAHVLIEEYSSPLADRMPPVPMPVLILLSAKEPQQLKEQANRLVAWIRQLNTVSNQTLADLAYTLQVGRTPFRERLALEVSTFPELENKLARYLAGETSIEGLYAGSVPDSKDAFYVLGADEDMTATVDAWVSKRKFGLLLDLWVKGLAFDWERLYKDMKAYQPGKISLPSYPFTQTRCWFRTGLERVAMILQKEWTSSPALAVGRIPGRMAIWYNSQTRVLAELLAGRLANVRLWNIGERPVPEEWKGLSGCIDLVGCGTDPEESMEWITWLQSLIEHGNQDSIHLLCVTRGLSAFRNNKVNLAGALRAGLYRMLGSEYRHVFAKQVDVDDDMAADDLVEVVFKELGLQEEARELSYRRGVRYASRLQRIEREDLFSGERISFPADQVLWITGGTRGLGYLCARHFAREYGVRRMVLTGRHPLPPREEWDACLGQDSLTAQRIKNILALEDMGCLIRVSAVDLTDGKALFDEFSEVKKCWGSVFGVLHCAGAGDYEDPAFIRKSAVHIREVIDPKVKGLDQLYRCLEREPLRFFLLFSSVSAAIPSLAAGQSAYAMANGYMDHFAEAHAGECPIISVQWPSWKETGMGEAKTNAYLRTGLLSLTDAEGLRFLDLLVRERPSPVVMPVVVDKDVFGVEQLLSPAKAGHDIPEPARETVMGWLEDLFASELKLPRAALKPDKPFPDYGIDSILITQLLQKIRKKMGLDIEPSVLFEYATLRSLTDYLAKTVPAAETPSSVGPDRGSSLSTGDIAVVGMACRFPGGESLEAYWNLLAEGRSAIRPIPRDRLDVSDGYRAGLLDFPYYFDPEFFLLKESDVIAMDPQALLVLEESLALFCHAGYGLDEVRGKAIGVYLGARSRHQPHPADLRLSRNPILAVGQNYLAANISQFFDLRGPSIVIDAACSSALVSMHMAIQALQQGELEAAVVGGVQLLNSEETFRLFQQRGLLSTANDFHVFDQRSEGIILGEGVGLVFLKRLDKALAAGDRIYGVVKSVSINNDGRTAGPAAPNIEAQKSVMRAALEKSNKQPEEISYIEVNGSGSEVTDLIELKAINAVYRSSGNSPCRLGSIKPNIGHPLCAEGIAGFIKVVEMLHRRQFVPFLSGNMPMKYFDLLSSPFQFSRVVCEWPDAPKVAAINCFADGGTNAHVILEAWQPGDGVAARSPLPVPALNRRRLRKSGMPVASDQTIDNPSIWESFK
jgi:polyketide synthase PksN